MSSGGSFGTHEKPVGGFLGTTFLLPMIGVAAPL
jgi:hypothetical protein